MMRFEKTEQVQVEKRNLRSLDSAKAVRSRYTHHVE